MKTLQFIIKLLLIGFCSCSITPEYTPVTFFPEGEIRVNFNENRYLSEKLHKFIEVSFFNDNKEWVEVSNLKFSFGSDEYHVLETQEQIDVWLGSRLEDLKKREAGTETLAGFGSLTLGIIASVAGEQESSDELLASSEESFAEAEQEEREVEERVLRAFRNTQLNDSMKLQPGERVKYWVIVNTPEQKTPNELSLRFTAKGLISKVEKSVELNSQN